MDPKLLAADLETHDPIVQRMHDTYILSCADLSTHGTSLWFPRLLDHWFLPSLSSRLIIAPASIGKAYARDFPLHLRVPTGAAAHNVIR